MSILIFANGKIEELNWIKSYLADASLIIAADGGAQHIAALGLRPHVIIGDFDSVTNELRQRLISEGTLFIEHNEEKDETDLELALLYATKHSNEKILIFGALGGRLDQTLGNIFLLAHPAVAGRSIELVEAGQRAWLVRSHTTVTGKEGDIVSLLPIGDQVVIEETTGLRWILQDESLKLGLTRGISNVLTKDTATISIRTGKLVCVHSDK